MSTDQSSGAPCAARSESQHVALIVTSEDEGQRLDKYLAGQLSDVSRATIQKWIVDGRVFVNGRPERASLRMVAGQSISIDTPAQPQMQALAEHIPLSVLYEDDSLAVIDKPAGMVVHPAAGHWEGTLVNALMARYPDLQDDGHYTDEESLPDAVPRPGIVHRLDKDTSGLIIVAKSPRIAELLQAQFQSRQVQKTYLALVHGIPSAAAGWIDAPIGRDPHQRKRMMVAPNGRPAQTHYRIIEHFEQYALLEVQPHTGRTHQIRVHLDFIGHPVVGDAIYGRRRHAVDCPRQFLHAWRIVFCHPITGESLSVESPMPADLRRVLQDVASLAV